MTHYHICRMVLSSFVICVSSISWKKSFFLSSRPTLPGNRWTTRTFTMDCLQLFHVIVEQCQSDSYNSALCLCPIIMFLLPLGLVADDDSGGKARRKNLLLENEDWWQWQADDPRPGITEAPTCLDTEQLARSGTLKNVKNVMWLQLTCWRCESPAFMDITELSATQTP